MITVDRKYKNNIYRLFIDEIKNTVVLCAFHDNKRNILRCKELNIPYNEKLFKNINNIMKRR